MKTKIKQVSLSYEDEKYSVYYDLTDDAGALLRQGVAFVPMSAPTLDAVLIEAVALLGADVDALAMPKDTAPQAVADAVAQLGLTRHDTEREQARREAAKQAADDADAMAAAKQTALAQLDAQIASKQAALADTIPAAAETKPGGLT